jgi:small subunit ribosomal protein S20
LANHKSALKRAKQSEERRLRNRARKTRMKTAIRGLEEAIAAGSRDAMLEQLQQAISVIDTTASKGVIHKNTASRKISRLTQRVNALVTA